MCIRDRSFRDRLGALLGALRLRDSSNARPAPGSDRLVPHGRAVKAHSRKENRAAISFHYDVSNEFYRLWLDDKVSSIGMFEHVGLANLPIYLATVRRVLRPGGLFLNHGITHDEEGWHKTMTTEFINRYVFPDGELDCISNIQLGMETVS